MAKGQDTGGVLKQIPLCRKVGQLGCVVNFSDIEELPSFTSTMPGGLFQAAAEAFMPKAGQAKPAAPSPESDDLAQLRAQMKAMQDKLDRMGG